MRKWTVIAILAFAGPGSGKAGGDDAGGGENSLGKTERAPTAPLAADQNWYYHLNEIKCVTRNSGA
jgi:hypothetical protein